MAMRNHAKVYLKENQVHQRPLFFVCHSLGGLILSGKLALDHEHLSQLTSGGFVAGTTEQGGARIAQA